MFLATVHNIETTAYLFQAHPLLLLHPYASIFLKSEYRDTRLTVTRQTVHFKPDQRLSSIVRMESEISTFLNYKKYSAFLTAWCVCYQYMTQRLNAFSTMTQNSKWLRCFLISHEAIVIRNLIHMIVWKSWGALLIIFNRSSGADGCQEHSRMYQPDSWQRL